MQINWKIYLVTVELSSLLPPRGSDTRQEPLPVPTAFTANAAHCNKSLIVPFKKDGVNNFLYNDSSRLTESWHMAIHLLAHSINRHSSFLGDRSNSKTLSMFLRWKEATFIQSQESKHFLFYFFLKQTKQHLTCLAYTRENEGCKERW